MSDQPIPFTHDDQWFERRAESMLKDALYTYLDDDKLINYLPSMIKGTILAAHKYHTDRAAQINFVYKVLFPEDRIDDV